MNPTLADIVLPLPIDRIFTYSVPPSLSEEVRPGTRVVVPFGKKRLTGVVVGTPTASQVKGLKALIDVADAAPTFSPEMLRLTRWISEYYCAPWGEVLKAATPQGLTQRSRGRVSLVRALTEGEIARLEVRGPKRRALLVELTRKGPQKVSQLQKATGVKGINALLADLASVGLIQVEEEFPSSPRPKTERTVSRTDGRPTASDSQTALTPKQRKILDVLGELSAGGSRSVSLLRLLHVAHTTLATVVRLERRGDVSLGHQEVLRSVGPEALEPPAHITLNQDQQRAVDRIASAVEAGAYRSFLLHGVTCSGKTQVYIESIRKTLEVRKSAIILVPEISLTPQTVRRFKAHFAERVAVMHSQMSSGERYDSWRAARDGRVDIVIGPRSAVFAPFPNLGLIVVDEEHEGSYKQFDASPRYNARDVALVRAQQVGAVAVLGSATPSVESYYNAVTRKHELLELPERVDEAKLPVIGIVDMTKERQRAYAELKKRAEETKSPMPRRLPRRSISTLLREQLRLRLERREGTILLQNRRGFSHVVECFDCGFVEQCNNCDVSLTYHATKKHLRCHYCGFVKSAASVCPKCGSLEFRMHSFGTQQIEEELREMFPSARILRMDRDTTTRKGSHDRLLQKFGHGEADILLGTQMVAKGLDFPHVSLVGVVSADTQMLLPDFRASEETFQLLTQVAGRAGRSRLAGEVVIQTYQPDHYSLRYVVGHDFRGFYDEELKFRRELDYPPFSRLVLVEFSGEREGEVEHHARKFVEILAAKNDRESFVLLGPADAAIPRVKRFYRKHIVLKDLKDRDPAGAHLRTALGSAKEAFDASPLGRNKTVRMTIDVDPQGMM